MGFEPTISVLEQAKTDHALGRAATVIGRKLDNIAIRIIFGEAGIRTT
jgi:hypothetical protein